MSKLLSVDGVLNLHIVKLRLSLGIINLCEVKVMITVENLDNFFNLSITHSRVQRLVVNETGYYDSQFMVLLIFFIFRLQEIKKLIFGLTITI